MKRAIVVLVDGDGDLAPLADLDRIATFVEAALRDRFRVETVEVDRPVGALFPEYAAKEGFTCPRCGRTSHNPNDIAERYCGSCHDWTDELDVGQPL